MSLVIVLVSVTSLVAFASTDDKPPSRLCLELRRYSAAEAHQGIAVDETHFFAVTNRGIGKYEKQTGKRIVKWNAPKSSSLKHLNSGVVVDGTLYCAHSNWPSEPLKNSIEYWDAETLEHCGRREFQDAEGAVTWVDRHASCWWVAFAFYGDANNVRKTTVVKYNDDWQKQAAWTFPTEVVDRFVPYSNSGGSFGPNGLLYATGHDRSELYALRIPRNGTRLELVDTLPINIAGQGIAWDRTDIGVVYGIHRKTKEVIVSRISHTYEYDKLLRQVKWTRDKLNPVLPPSQHGAADSTRCMNPWVLRIRDEYQLYYSGGDDKGRQRICKATARYDDITSWNREGPLFETGAKGEFDARWCVLPQVVQVAADQWHLYFTGNAGRGSGLSAFPGIGLATSHDGTTWTKYNTNPILSRTNNSGDPDAIGIAGGSVLRVTAADGKQEWRFYFTGCPTIGKPLPLNQQKTICLAVSEDGINWQRHGAVMLRDPSRDYENVGVAGPVVHQNKDGSFRMWYSAIGTRWGYYSICYAESKDGIHWRRGERVGDNLQLTPQGDGWEKQMVEYPSIVREGDRLRMFYCGNGYGRTGIGTAVSEPLESQKSD